MCATIACWPRSARKPPPFVLRLNEVVQMAVLDGEHVVYIARDDAARPVRLVSDLGSRLPAHCCALGKALLATLDDETVDSLLPAKLDGLTEHTLTRRSELLGELAEVRRSGLATERLEKQIRVAVASMADRIGRVLRA